MEEKIDSGLKENIIKFQAADYPRVGEHMSLKRCIETITGNSKAKIILKDGNAFIIIGKRTFQLIDLHSPCFRDTNTFLFDEYAYILLIYGEHVVRYNLESDIKIGFIEISKESENGYMDIDGKKYETVVYVKPNEKLKKSINDYIK